MLHVPLSTKFVCIALIEFVSRPSSTTWTAILSREHGLSSVSVSSALPLSFHLSTICNTAYYSAGLYKVMHELDCVQQSHKTVTKAASQGFCCYCAHQLQSSLKVLPWGTFLCAYLCITKPQKLIFHNHAQAACTNLTWLAWHP